MSNSCWSLTAHKEMNPANNYMNLEMDPYPVEPPVNHSPGNILITASQETLKQRVQLNAAKIPDLHQLCDNKYVLF